MFLDQHVGLSLESAPTNFGEAWNLAWNLKFKFLAENGYNELGSVNTII